MAKRKKVEVEILDFASVQEAQVTKEKCEKKLEKYPVARLVAIVASICGIIGGFCMVFGVGGGLARLVTPAFVGAIATYVLIGGLGIGFKCAGKIAVAGWYLIPFFPIDLFVLVFAFIFAVYALFLVPIVILRSIKKELQEDLRDAETYLSEHSA